MKIDEPDPPLNHRLNRPKCFDDGHYAGHVANYIKPKVGGHKLAQLPPSAVNEFRDAIRDDGVGVVTARKILATLSAVLNYAKGKDWVGANSADGVKVIGSRNEGAKKIRPPSKSDLKVVLTMANADLRLKIMFAAFTGLRASEQWALKWRNLDLPNGAVVVEERIDSYGEEGGTKSAAGDREVPLSDLLVQEIRKHRLASKFGKDDDYVFANAKGRHICHDNLMKRHYKPLLNEAISLASIGTAFDILPSRHGLSRVCNRRLFKPTLVIVVLQ